MEFRTRAFQVPGRSGELGRFEMEKLLYGRKIGSEEWQEQILCTQPARFSEVRVLAARDGFGHFREATFNGERPDFQRAVRA